METNSNHNERLNRMNEEFEQLLERLVKLNSFMLSLKYTKLSILKQDLLRCQYDAMVEYAATLRERIELESDEQQEPCSQPDFSHLFGKIVNRINIKCEDCGLNDCSCVKIDVPGIGTLCLDDNTQTQEKKSICF